jgi:oligopeptidase A
MTAIPSASEQPPAGDHPLRSADPRVRFSALRAEDIVPVMTRLLAESRARIAAIAEAPPTWDATLGELEDTELDLDRAMGLVRHLESVATTPEWRAAYNTIHPEVAAFLDGLILDPGLWAAIRRFAATPEAAALDPVRARHLQRVLDAFRREGADLPPDQKAQLERINRELSVLTSTYAQNVVDATAAWFLHVTDAERLAGLPASTVAAAREEAEKRGLEGWVLTLAMPFYRAVQTYATDASLREALYRAYARRATGAPHDNGPIVREILRLRREKAEILGFAHHADLVLSDRMAKDAARAKAFVRDLQERTRAAYDAETAALLAFRRETEGAGAPELAPWDVGFYSRLLQQARYAFDEEALRPWFPVERVLSGAFELFRRLYGLSITPDAAAEVWHPDVRAYEVCDESGVCGRFYVDLFPRPTKRDGAWMNPMMTSRPGVPHLGVVAGNLSPPVGDEPALLRFGEVETIFHELGHLLHHLTSRVPVRSLSGSAVAWDFVELPSQIHENFCYLPSVMELISGHWQSGEPLPAEHLAALRRARTFRAATDQMRQLAFAETDLALHVEYDPARDGDVMTYAREILQRGTPAPLPDDHALLAAFTHLFASPVAYSAGYYSYKWAEVLDADAFETLAPGETIDPAAGRRFLAAILSRGNSAPPEQLFEEFVGRPPSLDALLRRSGLA